MALKQVIVFRKDIQMNKGKMVAQGAHAAMLCLLYVIPEDQETMVYDWAHNAMAKIVCGVDTLEKLDELEKSAEQAGLLCYAVIDSGKTVFAGKPTKTCIAIGPAEDIEIDKITGTLKLI